MAQATFDDLARHVGTTQTRRAALAAMLGAALGQLTTHSAAARGNNRLKHHPTCLDLPKRCDCTEQADCGEGGECIYGTCREFISPN
jgi:hypothetical protein